MKKLGVIVLLVIVLFSFISLAMAADVPPGMPEGSDKVVDAIDNSKNTIDSATSGNYNLNPTLVDMNKPLIVDNEEGGWKGVFFAVSDFFSLFNPFFKMVLGVEYGLNLTFIFAIIIWLILFFLISPIMATILGKDLWGYVAGFCIASLIGLGGFIKMLLPTIWLALGAVVLGILALLFSSIFTSKKAKEEQAKEQEQKDREVLHTAAEAAKEQLKSKDGK